MAAFATLQDVITLFRPLSTAEEERAQALLETVSARLRMEAVNVRKNLDRMIADDETGSLAEVAKSITVDIVGRTLNTPVTGDTAPLSQYSESALGYTFSGTFLSGGGGIFIKKAELAALGLRRPRYWMADLGGQDNAEGNNN